MADSARLLGTRRFFGRSQLATPHPASVNGIIATFEVNTWSFQDGQYTDPDLRPFQKSSGETYVSLGPGMGMCFCDRLDFGIGAAFAVVQ